MPITHDRELDLTRRAAASPNRQARLLAATRGIHLDLYLNGYPFLPGHRAGHKAQPVQAAWPKLEKILKKRPIDWDLIARSYDQMIKYVTALRLRTAETEQVLRRFMKRAAPQAAGLPRPGGTRPGRADHLRLRLPRRRAAPPRDQQRPAGRGELELRQRQDLLRPGRRPHRSRPRARRGVRARAAAYCCAPSTTRS